MRQIPGRTPAVEDTGTGLPSSVPTPSYTPKVLRPVGKRCGVCGHPIEPGEVMVPLSGLGAHTVWAHKACR